MCARVCSCVCRGAVEGGHRQVERPVSHLQSGWEINDLENDSRARLQVFEMFQKNLQQCYVLVMLPSPECSLVCLVPVSVTSQTLELPEAAMWLPCFSVAPASAPEQGTEKCS